MNSMNQVLKNKPKNNNIPIKSCVLHPRLPIVPQKQSGFEPGGRSTTELHKIHIDSHFAAALAVLRRGVQPIANVFSYYYYSNNLSANIINFVPSLNIGRVHKHS